jgi:hypothetical protein
MCRTLTIVWHRTLIIFIYWEGPLTCEDESFRIVISPEDGWTGAWDLSTFLWLSSESCLNFDSRFDCLRFLYSSSRNLSSTTSNFIGLLLNPPFLVYFCTYLGLLLSSYRYLTLASSLLALELLVAGLDFGLMNSNRNELLFGFSLDSSLSFCIQNKVSGSSLVNEENRHRESLDP